MSKPDYKLVTWGDYSIPVYEDYKWLAQDGDGEWFVYKKRPMKRSSSSDEGYWISRDHLHDIEKPLQGRLDPPEPGPWDEQLYWIG